MQKMRKIYFKSLFLAFAVGLAACSDNEPKGQDPGTSPVNPGQSSGSVFIVNEGGFMNGNASLSLLDITDNTIRNEVFRTANGFGPGDVAQSMTISPDSPYAWLVVNNSQVIFAIDPDTFVEKGRIAGDILSPRKIQFITPEKAYVTQFYTPSIAVINPVTFSVTKQIEYPIEEGASPSTGDMVKVDNYVYVCCPNSNSAVLKIDATTDQVVDHITPGIQPTFIVADKNKDLWVLCNGAYQGAEYGYEAPRLVKVSTTDFKVKKEFRLTLGAYIARMVIDPAGENIYWIAGDVFRMSIAAESLPANPLIKSKGEAFYGMTIEPEKGDIFVTDAVDYTQQGRVLRYKPDGSGPVAEYTAGVIPSAFCWK